MYDFNLTLHFDFSDHIQVVLFIALRLEGRHSAISTLVEADFKNKSLLHWK